MNRLHSAFLILIHFFVSIVFGFTVFSPNIFLAQRYRLSF